MKASEIILTVTLSTFAGALGFGLYNYLARKKALPAPVPAQPISTTQPSTTQPAAPSQPIVSPPPQPSPQPSPQPTGAQSLTRNWTMDYSNCTCVQGYGGSLTYSECQQSADYCKQFHNAASVYIQ